MQGCAAIGGQAAGAERPSSRRVRVRIADCSETTEPNVDTPSGRASEISSRNSSSFKPVKSLLRGWLARGRSSGPEEETNRPELQGGEAVGWSIASIIGLFRAKEAWHVRALRAQQAHSERIAAKRRQAHRERRKRRQQRCEQWQYLSALTAPSLRSSEPARDLRRTHTDEVMAAASTQASAEEALVGVELQMDPTPLDRKASHEGGPRRRMSVPRRSSSSYSKLEDETFTADTSHLSCILSCREGEEQDSTPGADALPHEHGASSAAEGGPEPLSTSRSLLPRKASTSRRRGSFFSTLMLGSSPAASETEALNAAAPSSIDYDLPTLVHTPHGRE